MQAVFVTTSATACDQRRTALLLPTWGMFSPRRPARATGVIQGGPIRARAKPAACGGAHLFRFPTRVPAKSNSVDSHDDRFSQDKPCVIARLVGSSRCRRALELEVDNGFATRPRLLRVQRGRASLALGRRRPCTYLTALLARDPAAQARLSLSRHVPLHARRSWSPARVTASPSRRSIILAEASSDTVVLRTRSGCVPAFLGSGEPANPIRRLHARAVRNSIRSAWVCREYLGSLPSPNGANRRPAVAEIQAVAAAWPQRASRSTDPVNHRPAPSSRLLLEGDVELALPAHCSFLWAGRLCRATGNWQKWHNRVRRRCE